MKKTKKNKAVRRPKLKQNSEEASFDKNIGTVTAFQSPLTSALYQIIPDLFAELSKDKVIFRDNVSEVGNIRIGGRPVLFNLADPVLPEDNPLKVQENDLEWQRVPPNPAFRWIDFSREGITFEDFSKIVEFGPFTMKEWAKLIHLNERTLQRYKAENKSFEQIYTEKILSITQVLLRGVSVFGNKEHFFKWLNTNNVYLGNTVPGALLDSTFGIALIEEELTRIEHGVLA